MLRSSTLLLALLAMACTTVGPRGGDEQWRVVSTPGGATVTTNFGATCRSPCNVRIPDAPFDIRVEREGYIAWVAHYDPARPNELEQLAAAPDRATNAAAGAVIAGAGLAAAGGGLASGSAIAGVAVLGALPWMLGPRVRRLEIRLAPLS